MIKATIIADSVSAHTGQRITTFELEYPRFVHSELMTHRQFSRNAASSRAIPIDKMIEQVSDDPAVPLYWGLNQSGMQAKDEEADESLCLGVWLDARNKAVESARALQSLGLHKQIVNRVLEPFQMMKTLVTATSFDNFFNLRCHKDAQPEIKHLADLMYQARQDSTPEVLRAGEWHLPYIEKGIDEDTGEYFYYVRQKGYYQTIDLDTAIKISCSCAAQVSYRKNDTSIEKALAIYDKLVNSEPVHASAFEHCATPIYNERQHGITHIIAKPTELTKSLGSGNFENWVQYRQLIPNHNCKNYKEQQ